MRIQLGDEQHWYCEPHLFKDVLYQRLTQTMPDTIFNRQLMKKMQKSVIAITTAKKQILCISIVQSIERR